MANKQKNKPINRVPMHHLPLPQVKGRGFDAGFLLPMQLRAKKVFFRSLSL